MFFQMLPRDGGQSNLTSSLRILVCSVRGDELKTAVGRAAIRENSHRPGRSTHDDDNDDDDDGDDMN